MDDLQTFINRLIELFDSYLIKDLSTISASEAVKNYENNFNKNLIKKYLYKYKKFEEYLLRKDFESDEFKELCSWSRYVAVRVLNDNGIGDQELYSLIEEIKFKLDALEKSGIDMKPQQISEEEKAKLKADVKLSFVDRWNARHPDKPM